MPNKATSRKSGRKRAPISRADLLPLPVARASVLSMTMHMALAAVRAGHGDLAMLGELLKTVYVAYFISHAERHNPCIESFVEAERALKAGMDRGENEGVWCIDNDAMDTIEAVLALHDQQLNTLASYRIERGKERLRNILDKGVFPDLACYIGLESEIGQ